MKTFSTQACLVLGLPAEYWCAMGCAFCLHTLCTSARVSIGLSCPCASNAGWDALATSLAQHLVCSTHCRTTSGGGSQVLSEIVIGTQYSSPSPCVQAQFLKGLHSMVCACRQTSASLYQPPSGGIPLGLLFHYSIGPHFMVELDLKRSNHSAMLIGVPC